MPHTFKDLLGKDGAYYTVPSYQRDYAWEETNWDDLWEDIINSNEEHFMGFIILKKRAESSFEIIDGQQRIATCIILLAACIKYLEQLIQKTDPKNREVEIGRRDKLKNSYFFNSESKENEIIPVQKIHLNKANDKTFSWLLEHPLEVIQNYKETKSSQRIISAFNFFYKKLESVFGNEKSGFQLFDFVEKKIGNMLSFTTLTVQDDEDAYVLFETLNSRGVQLAQADLLKNRLLSKVNDKVLSQAIAKWDSLSEFIDKEEITTLVRWDWIMRKPRVTEKNLFHAISPSISSSKEAMHYLDQLLMTSRTYHIIVHPKDYQLNNKEGYKKAADVLEKIEILGNKIPMPLLLAAYQKLDGKRFSKLCGYLEIILFRYSIISRKDLKPLEQKITEMANHIYAEDVDFSWLEEQLKTLYISDKEFKDDFSKKGSIYKTSIIRYILNKLNQRKDNLNFTIEHILDLQPKAGLFPAFNKKEHANNVKRIGNLMLLDSVKNGSLTGKGFLEKKVVYKKSNEIKDLFTTKSVVKYKDWTPDSLQKRQEEMAKEACKIWCIKGW